MNENDDAPEPSGILFDQWSRYDAVARAVRAIAPDGGRVLDVGCGGQMLLGTFLPGHEVTYLDPLLTGHTGEDLIAEPLSDDTVPGQSFDVVVSVDVLEHLPGEARVEFLAQMMRASRRGVVVAAPFADKGDARSTDGRVNELYRLKNGVDYSWLHEHLEFGLPELAATTSQLRDGGFHVTTFGNGHTPWLKDLLALHVLQLDQPSNMDLLRRIGNRFAQDLLGLDHLEPTYRQVLVADRLGEASVELPEVDPRAAAEAWGPFRAWVEVQVSLHQDTLTKAWKSEITSTRAQLEVLRERLAHADRRFEATQDELRDLRQDAKTSRRLRNEAQARARAAQQNVAALQGSWSWRLSAPLRWSAHGATTLATPIRAATLRVATHGVRLLPERWRWPLKSTFFTVLRPLLQNSREYVEWQEAKRWRDRPAPPPPLVIEPPHDTLPDVIVFGVIDWRLRIQRPQQLALELARRGHRVLYLSPNFEHKRKPGYQIEALEDGAPIYQVHLHTSDRVSIYEGAPSALLRDNLLTGLRKLFGDVGLRTNLCIVDHPGWVEIAQRVPRSQLIYDCMDNHQGFLESGSKLPSDERQLIEACDAVVVTSDHIRDHMAPLHGHVRMIRNACAPEHFACQARPFIDGERPRIGYFGAIADWFDAALVEQVAARMQDCDFVLIGGDTAGVQAKLAHLENVRFVGEVDYAELPGHVRMLDVLLIPFLINPLTLATNPVKAYEALAAGKPVVATPMPELMDTDLAPFVRIGADSAEIEQHLRATLAERGHEGARQERVAFARQQTWSQRADDLIVVASELRRPRVAVVVVTWNGVALSRRCVRSVLDDPLAPELDVIIVDNASTDETPAWLEQIELDPRVRVIRNEHNRGFSAACNQGLAAGAAAHAELLVILNNDVVVTPGWANTMTRHLRRDPSIGLIGPITNNIGNEAKVDTAYEDIQGMLCEQRCLTGKAAGLCFDIPVLAFFCVAVPRDVYELVGALDENFGTGFFEDDDYCQRVREIGRRIVCAEDVFVHHELSASFGTLLSEERQKLFDRNKAYYESKWGPWRRHVYRPRAGANGDAAAS